MNPREDINLYVVGLLQTVAGLQVSDGAPCVFRNRGELPPREKTPGIIYLDGVMERVTPTRGMNLSYQPPGVYVIRPEIVLALTPRDLVTNSILDGVSNPVGPEMAAFEERIVSVLLGDDTLVAMMGDDGSVSYLGYESDMRNGSTIGSTGAVMIFKFEFAFVLDASTMQNV